MTYAYKCIKVGMRLASGTKTLGASKTNMSMDSMAPITRWYGSRALRRLYLHTYYISTYMYSMHVVHSVQLQLQGKQQQQRKSVWWVHTHSVSTVAVPAARCATIQLVMQSSHTYHPSNAR